MFGTQLFLLEIIKTGHETGTSWQSTTKRFHIQPEHLQTSWPCPSHSFIDSPKWKAVQVERDSKTVIYLPPVWQADGALGWLQR